MVLKTKYSVVRFSLLLFTLIFVSGLNAQSCKADISTALDYYDYPEYEHVPGVLNTCLIDFYHNKKKNLKEKHRDRLFLVYKLIIKSYEGLDYNDEVVKRKNKLIEYLDGVMREEDVMQKLEDTEIDPV